MKSAMKQSFDPDLAHIAEKVTAGERLDFSDGLVLDRTQDILALGEMANIVRERINGNNAYYINNRHINHTNVCVNTCKFCAFSRKEEDDDAYTMSVETALAEAHKHDGEDFSEFHIVGGLNPGMPYEYYIDLVKKLHDDFPNTHIQAYTAVEIAYFAEISGQTVEKTLLHLKEVGLGSLPGGGAEIFNEKVRKKICPEKIDGNAWLDVHKTAHEIGLNSNATMLYGHIESAEDRVDHLIKLRNLQDQTNGFLTFIPLAFHPKNTKYGDLPRTSGQMDLRMIAMSRLMLDNFPHIKAFWIMIGEKIAQVSLSFGADDMDGTVMEEKITHSAGAETNEMIAKNRIERLIIEAGRTPVERDTIYNVVSS